MIFAITAIAMAIKAVNETFLEETRTGIPVGIRVLSWTTIKYIMFEIMNRI